MFNACEEAVQEIVDLIHRISVSGNTYHFIVTADHGFIYKRDKLTAVSYTHLERFLRKNTSVQLAKYETIKEAKRVEMLSLIHI